MTVRNIQRQRAIKVMREEGRELVTFPTWSEIGAEPQPPVDRWPNIRAGERQPITSLMRIGVGRRDNFTCRHCHTDCATSFELDHIIPWSAGGSDLSDNLRVFCQQCNQARSNLVDGTEARKPMLVTWWCVQCWTDENRKYSHSDPTGRECITGVVNEYATHHVYCAHCRCRSRSDIALGANNPNSLVPDVTIITVSESENQ